VIRGVADLVTIALLYAASWALFWRFELALGGESMLRASDQPGVVWLFEAVVDDLMLFGAACWFAWRRHFRLRPLLVAAGTAWGPICIGLLVGVALSPLLRWLEIHALMPIGLQPAYHPDLDLLASANSTAFCVAFFILVGVLSPVVEELLFRGAIQQWLFKESGLAPALVATNILFALVHVYPTLIVISLVVGLVLAALAIATRSLLAPIAAHVAFNLIGVTGVLMSSR
jgi:membrane protease YdiL (CAAX protease family)